MCLVTNSPSQKWRDENLRGPQGSLSNTCSVSMPWCKVRRLRWLIRMEWGRHDPSNEGMKSRHTYRKTKVRRTCALRETDQKLCVCVLCVILRETGLANHSRECLWWSISGCKHRKEGSVHQWHSPAHGANICTWTHKRLCRSHGLKQWGPWRGCAHVSSTHSLRTSSIPHRHRIWARLRPGPG